MPPGGLRRGASGVAERNKSPHLPTCFFDLCNGPRRSWPRLPALGLSLSAKLGPRFALPQARFAARLLPLSGDSAGKSPFLAKIPIFLLGVKRVFYTIV